MKQRSEDNKNSNNKSEGRGGIRSNSHHITLSQYRRLNSANNINLMAQRNSNNNISQTPQPHLQYSQVQQGHSPTPLRSVVESNLPQRHPFSSQSASPESGGWRQNNPQNYAPTTPPSNLSNNYPNNFPSVVQQQQQIRDESTRLKEEELRRSQELVMKHFEESFRFAQQKSGAQKPFIPTQLPRHFEPEGSPPILNRPANAISPSFNQLSNSAYAQGRSYEESSIKKYPLKPVSSEYVGPYIPPPPFPPTSVPPRPFYPQGHGGSSVRGKVSSPAPAQIYGKPSLPPPPHDYETEEPLQLTAKSIPYNNIYPYNSSPFPFKGTEEEGYQTQPLDLGGKRKLPPHEKNEKDDEDKSEESSYKEHSEKRANIQEDSTKKLENNVHESQSSEIDMSKTFSPTQAQLKPSVETKSPSSLPKLKKFWLHNYSQQEEKVPEKVSTFNSSAFVSNNLNSPPKSTQTTPTKDKTQNSNFIPSVIKTEVLVKSPSKASPSKVENIKPPSNNSITSTATTTTHTSPQKFDIKLEDENPVSSSERDDKIGWKKGLNGHGSELDKIRGGVESESESEESGDEERKNGKGGGGRGKRGKKRGRGVNKVKTNRKRNNSLHEDEEEVMSERDMRDSTEDFEESSKETDSNSGSPKKRGRKSLTHTRSTEPKRKSNPFKRPPVSILKKSGESFLQDGPCSEVAPKLGKCRECRLGHKSKGQLNIFCRFLAFRKLRYTKTGTLVIAGFSDPVSDPTEDDINLWVPSKEETGEDLELGMAKFLLQQLGDQFCDLIGQEKEATSLSLCGEKRAVAWKRVVQGVREMCDTCDTTIFNFHWACSKCGFVVCISCYKARLQKEKDLDDSESEGVRVGPRERDEFNWLPCSNNKSHVMDKLMLTQTVAGDALFELGSLVHKLRAQLNIPQECHCSEGKPSNSQLSPSLSTQITNENNNELSSSRKTYKKEEKVKAVEEEDVVLKVEEARAVEDEVKKVKDENGDGEDLENLFMEEGVAQIAQETISSTITTTTTTTTETTTITTTSSDSTSDTTSDITISAPTTTITPPVAPEDEIGDESEVRELSSPPPGEVKKVTNKDVSVFKSTDFPGIPHKWLCFGKLLLLLDPHHEGNMKIFQEVWKRGLPVIVSNVSDKLNKVLWSPESFLRDFSELRNDLVNCMTGRVVPNQPMKIFWDGFEHVEKRLKDDNGVPMLLKLKDWPPGQDFAETLPSRFKDLMSCLPVSEYTNRNGNFNLASRLPDSFVKPDLGPKMYIAYGSGVHLDKGTTNLHLDISDAVNLMVYVGVPKDCDNTEHNAAVLEAIENSDVDGFTIDRVKENGEIPGALWHIYRASDADKIRELLNLVALEQDVALEPNHDPIHDQKWYLDKKLRERLNAEYDVLGFPIVQFMGDAVFIPAGAPHQVRNLQNCIKIAEDFVSPENVSHCFHLTEEFRNLSETHTNHEDKLQIKNIIYHAVKDAVSVLSRNDPEY